MFKLLYHCADPTCQQDNAQNLSGQASTVHELRNSRCTSCIQKRQRNQRSNCQQWLDHRENKEIPEKHLLVSLTMLKPLTVQITKTVENSSRDENTRLPCLSPEKPVCRSRSNRTTHGIMNWFKIGKGICQGYILSLSLFNLHAK